MIKNSDYIHIIESEFLKRRSKNPSYSMRAFARALKISNGALSQILNGKRTPSLRTARRLISMLQLNPKTQESFVLSLASKQKSRKLKRLSPVFRNVKAHPQYIGISQDHFKVIAEWYHVAILELTFTEDFNPEPAVIARRLGISVVEVNAAIRRLFEQGLLKKKSNGGFEKSNQNLITHARHLTSTAHQSFQKQILEKSIFALQEIPIELRNHTGMTMAIDPDKLPTARKMCEEFSQKLCDFLESGSKKKLYQLSLSLFPLEAFLETKKQTLKEKI